MTSWSDAFGKAIRVSIITLGWVVIGIIIMAIGYYIGAPSDPYSDYNYAIIALTTILGIILISFGGVAAIFKIVGDMIEESKYQSQV